MEATDCITNGTLTGGVIDRAWTLQADIVTKELASMDMRSAMASKMEKLRIDAEARAASIRPKDAFFLTKESRGSPF